MPRKSKPTKKTFILHVIAKGAKKDFGLGPGVLVEREVTYTDERGHGFDSERFALSCMLEDDEILRDIFAVVRTPKPSKTQPKRHERTNR
jgi:hypothetical protein